MTFHDLYEKYAGDVYRFALFLTGDAAEADDLASETFVRAWTAGGQIRQATVKAYLFTIVRNLHRDVMRKQRRQDVLDDSIAEASPSADRVEQRVEVSRVLDGIRRLPALDRTLLMLRVHDEMSYDEIGEAVGMEPAAVRMRVHRARAKLSESKGGLS
jgi:RNA polymerase sigma-70 factor (ECF subfamily)